MYNSSLNTTGKYFIIFLLVSVLLTYSKLVVAETAETKSDDVIVTLSAPDPILKLLNQYFELPDKPLTNVTAQRAFFRRAQREIKVLLATEGYFTPKIDLVGNWQDKDNAPILTVDPGQLTRISKIDIEFQGDMVGSDPKKQARIQALRESWQLKIKQPFRSADWEQEKTNLLSRITEKDYAAANIVDSKAVVDTENALVELTVVIDSGPVFYFGELEITGLERYDESIVRNLMLFKVGTPYKRDLLHRFQISLQAIPHFKSVSVSIVPDITQHKAVPIQVVLTEAQSQTIAVGGGYSSNNGARGEINFKNYNLLDRALYLNSTLRLEQRRQTYFAGIDTLPNQNNVQYSLGGSLQRTDIQDLETIKQKVGLIRNYRTRQIHDQIELSWQREEKRPSGSINQINEALVLDWRLRHHVVDDPLHIRKGTVTEVHVGGGSQVILSEQEFIRSYVRHQSWWPIGEKDVFFLRGEVGYTLAESRFGIPQAYLFRAGGIHSVRGYSFNRLGVREGNAIVGGRTLATGTLEYTHWFMQHWGAAFFGDIGSAADRWQNMHAFIGYGAGVRWRSPAGPLALDVARANETGSFRVHFSMAVAF
ncbi:MAG: BamA/TamA family outer membrane protein [Nitrosomonas sp.]|nr:BamA/TamA family outer membrane protein [Nitrosomonas sp.]